MTTANKETSNVPALHIATAKEIPNGLGLGVKTTEIKIKEVKTGSKYQANSKSQFFEAEIEAEFLYEAGYELGANLLLKNSGDDIDVSNESKLTEFIKNGNFTVSINLNSQFDENTEWWLCAKNQHILNEIESVSEENLYYPGMHSVDEFLTFPKGGPRSNVGYEIEDCLQSERAERPTTGFTREVVEDFYQQLRLALLVFTAN